MEIQKIKSWLKSKGQQFKFTHVYRFMVIRLKDDIIFSTGDIVSTEYGIGRIVEFHDDCIRVSVRYDRSIKIPGNDKTHWMQYEFEINALQFLLQA